MLAGRNENRKGSDPAYRVAKEKGGNFGGNCKMAVSAYQYQQTKYSHRSVRPPAEVQKSLADFGFAGILVAGALVQQ